VALSALAEARARIQALLKDHQSAAGSANDWVHHHRPVVAQLREPAHLGSPNRDGALDLKLLLQEPEARFGFLAGLRFQARERVAVAVPERQNLAALHYQNQALRPAMRWAAVKQHLERTFGVGALGSMKLAAGYLVHECH
jgi:hypothetical protein